MNNIIQGDALEVSKIRPINKCPYCVKGIYDLVPCKICDGKGNINMADYREYYVTRFILKNKPSIWSYIMKNNSYNIIRAWLKVFRKEIWKENAYCNGKVYTKSEKNLNENKRTRI